MWLGRFAPSPTGPLHAGSLLAAVASYLDVKSRNGQWLLRIEDIDILRNVDGAETLILRSLERHGLLWDRTIERQTTTDAQARYALALQQLFDQPESQLFYCTCRRRDRAMHGGIYNGHCRQQMTPPSSDYAVRLRIDDHICHFTDRILGTQKLPMSELGDVIIKRKDGLFAYQLAVVIDDAHAGINTVTRGCDLLSSTPWQITLQRLLKLPPVEYAHLPLLVDLHGDKLSKQQRAAPIDDTQALQNLYTALTQLKQPLSRIADYANCDALLKHAIECWKIDKIPQSTITVDES